MSAKTITRQSLHPSTPERQAPVLEEWEIYEGYAGIFLVGPGPEAMLRCSLTIPATGDEMAIAERSLVLLNERYRENRDAGVAEIRAVLVECGWVQ